MSIVKQLECNGCGKRVEYGKFEGKWYQVQSMVANQHSMMEMLGKLGPMSDLVDETTGTLKDGVLDSITDSGDFCSLECLANWSSARANLRALDAELDT